MAIILSSQTGPSSSALGDVLGDLSESFGIPGFPQSNNTSKATSDLSALSNRMNDVFNKLLGKSNDNFDPNYVDSGSQVVVGGNIQAGKVPPLEQANVRQIYTQSPQISVLIKKRSFSSLQSLYNPIYMDPSEKWLIRATKRLVASKCDAMAEYERLSKIEKLSDLGLSPGAIISSLITSANIDEQNYDEALSSMELEQIIRLRQPVKTTTYFTDTSLPLIENLGVGSGVFEITSISNVSTSLGIDGASSVNFSIEDPYRVLFVTETDIEMALRDTMLSPIVNSLSSSAADALMGAQATDELLQKSLRERGMGEITFTIAVGGSQISATIDALGMEINPDNLDDIPEEYSFQGNEESYFVTVYSGLTLYNQSMNKTLLGGANLINTKEEVKEQMEYARKKLRLFHLGKSIVQPMDTVNIFLSGGTRKTGEGESIDDLFSVKSPIEVIRNIVNGGDSTVDEDLLRQEHERYGNYLTFEDFKRLRTVTFSTEAPTSVIGGLITSVEDRFDANSGSYTLNVSGESNMHWLSVSRYNSNPSLTQMQNLVYDPLTPFQFELDKATGLPTGKPKLNEANRKLLEDAGCRLYFNSGPKTGKQAKGIDDLEQDIQRIGGNLISLYQHVPGLVYRWKEGIMTAVYNQYNTNPLDGTLSDMGQIKRDIGLHAVNSPFDNMDSANILSILITGKPYNYSTFVQSAINSTTFIPDTTLNSGKDYFQSLVRNLRSEIEVNGNFVPFKSINVSPEELATSIGLQRQLSNKSSQLQKLRNEQATLFDKITNYPGGIQDKNLQAVFNKKNNDLENKINELTNSLSSLTERGQELDKNIIQVAGNDISFDLSDISSEEKFKLFGDRLLHATQRKKEDVIRNIDKNYLIISDEYDKDYDIQSFVLKLREQGYNLWKGSWQSVIQLCRTVAETLNFELFSDSQGHIVFRPPQYNRIPASVLDQMLSLSHSGGIKLFPEFLTHLFKSKEQALLNEVVITEWEIVKQGALIGKKDISEVEELVYGSTGSPQMFIINQKDKVKDAAELSRAISDLDREALLYVVRDSNYQTQMKNLGAFAAKAQRNLQKELINTSATGENLNSLGVKDKSLGSEGAYNEAVKSIAKLTGQQRRSQPEYDKEKIGAVINGNSNPSSDVDRIISKISSLVSVRAKLLRSLEKILDQNIEIAELSGDGQMKIRRTSPFSTNLSSNLYNKLIEDDGADTLGHMSGNRFVINDDHIISATFSEKPPAFTNISVKGSFPIIGGKGEIAGIPELTAIAADFDLWRQYGWRSDKTVDKPFFSDAQLQCAPYAIMLLSRQRRNIVTGSITVMGNEFYQLGDVVYVAHRQMLYYVERVQHTISYDGNFTTTLELKYGHPPGDYIPTPLDIIGKQMINSGNSQVGYRIRRETPRFNSFLAAVVFNPDDNDLLKGKHAKRNFERLVGAATVARAEIDESDTTNSARVYAMTFFGDEDRQNTRANEVLKWFKNPERPVGSNNSAGKATIISANINNPSNLQGFKIHPDLLEIDRVNQCLPQEETLSAAEEDLLAQGITASQEAIALDPSLGNVVEIHLRQPPVGGWPKEDATS